MKTKKTQQPKKSQQASMPVIPATPKPSLPQHPARATPTPETLAMIAATLGKGATEQPATAIGYATKLYDAACEHLESKARYSTAKQAEVDSMATIPQPENGFPALFADFLRLIVKAKTPADSTKRFRDYQRDDVKRQEWASDTIGDFSKTKAFQAKFYAEKLTLEQRRDRKWDGMTEQQIGEVLIDEALENRVAQKMAEWKHYGFPSRDCWCGIAKHYCRWWANQKSAQAQAAGKKSRKSD
jgi:hypothetical protein